MCQRLRHRVFRRRLSHALSNRSDSELSERWSRRHRRRGRKAAARSRRAAGRHGMPRARPTIIMHTAPGVRVVSGISKVAEVDLIALIALAALLGLAPLVRAGASETITA